jgi:GMP synthase-like glutamine amidotransferase
MPRACVLQHIRCEPPGIFGDLLRAHGIEIDTAQLDEGDELPDWHDVDLVLAMGGPMGANDEAEHPWLAREKQWIAGAVRDGKPYLGVCLGSQLLAASLGAQVRAGPAPEVGVLPVALTADGKADPVFAALGPQFTALQWHCDTFDLPDDAVHLGSSAAYPNQAFRFGDVAYAVQFHVEVSDWMLEEWRHVPAYHAAAENALGKSGFESLARAFADARESMIGSATRLFDGWLSRAGVTAGRSGATVARDTS